MSCNLDADTRDAVLLLRECSSSIPDPFPRTEHYILLRAQSHLARGADWSIVSAMNTARTVFSNRRSVELWLYENN